MPTKLILAVVTAAILAVFGITLASAAADDPHAHASGTELSFFTVTDQTATIDVDRSGGPSVGDEEVFSDRVYEERGGPRVGTDGGVCTLVHVDTSAGTVTEQCVATLSLSEGQITVQGLATFSTSDEPPEPFDLAITGGTGDFEGASGHLTVELLSETEANLTFHLLG